MQSDSANTSTKTVVSSSTVIRQIYRARFAVSHECVRRLLRPALKLQGAELVVLSACNSATGEPWQTLDEAVGFPAALLAAGARTVVAAQSEVSDAVTLLVMHRFGDCAPLANETNFAAFLTAIFRKQWVVYAKPPFGGPEHVSALPGALHASSRHFPISVCCRLTTRA